MKARIKKINYKEYNNFSDIKYKKPALNSPLEKTKKEPKEDKDKNNIFV
jgi:hypothetical protein